MLSSVFNLFVPKRCDICGKVIGFLPCCDVCSPHIDKLTLGVTKPQKIKLKNLVFVDDIFSCFSYKHCVKTGVLRMKFGGYRFLSKCYAKHMSQLILQLDRHFDVVVFVPMTKKKQKARKANPAFVLAKYISKTIDVPLREDFLIKIIDTKEQHLTEYKLRACNLLGCMKVPNPDQVAGLDILLIDDIITTGHTVNTCAKLLKVFDAKTVTAITFAAVEPPSKSSYESRFKNDAK